MKVLKSIFPMAFPFTKSGGMLALGIVLHIAAMIACPVACALIWLFVVAMCGVAGFLLGLTVILSPLAIFVGIIGGSINVCVIGVGIVFEFYCLTSIVMAILGYAKVFGPSEKEKISAEQVVADAPVEETVENTEK